MFKHIIIFLAAAFMLASCTDDYIGGSITDTRSTVIEDSSFVITGKSVRNERLLARTSSQLLGIIKSDGFGTLSAQVVTQMMPANSIDTTGVTEDLIDSCKLVLRIPENGFTGDQTAPMQLSVYRLAKQLPTPLYSDLDPEGYYQIDGLLGTAAYSPKTATTVYDATTSDVNYYRETYVDMPVSLARELFAEFKKNPETFNSPGTFTEFFPGLYITNSFGSGRIMNFSHVEFKVFYTKKTTNVDGDVTTTSDNSRIYMAASPEVYSNNLLALDIDPAVTQAVADGDAIVMAPAGYEVEVKFPIQDIIESFKHNTSGDLAKISQLTLTLPVETMNTQYTINPPQYLLMVKTSKKDQFIAGDSLTNSKDSFYATYDSANKCYTFTGLRNYVLNIINNQGGVATDDDVNLTITPVDVTTYTTQASYYSTSQTVVTKIAPQVSVPAITKLKLDKAKIKISYSKLTVM